MSTFPFIYSIVDWKHSIRNVYNDDKHMNVGVFNWRWKPTYNELSHTFSLVVPSLHSRVAPATFGMINCLRSNAIHQGTCKNPFINSVFKRGKVKSESGLPPDTISLHFDDHRPTIKLRNNELPKILSCSATNATTIRPFSTLLQVIATPFVDLALPRIVLRKSQPFIANMCY